MDLLELNDIYCRDKARIKNERIFQKDVHIEYSFVPTEDGVFSSDKDYPLECIVNHPFRGSASKSFRHDLSEFTEYVTDINSTSWYDDNELKYWVPQDSRELAYDQMAMITLQYHPDILFSDELPGLTIAMSSIKNENDEFSRRRKSIPAPVKMYTTENGLPVDGRALSLIYIKKDGSVKHGYGPMVFLGRGMTSLPYEMKTYLLSNTNLIRRGCGLKKDDWENMRTSCLILYEDSLERILKAIDNDNER